MIHHFNLQFTSKYRNRFNILMKNGLPIISLITLIIVVCGAGCTREDRKKIETRGVYGHPRPFWDKGLELSALGINAVFVHSGSIREEMIRRARSEGLRVYAEFATLNGKGYVDEHPEAWAIDEKGKRVGPASWFMGVCPTEPGFRQYRIGQLRELMRKLDLDGVWMDYFHWHAQFEEPEPILPETCFCNNCLESFSIDSGIQLPEGTIPEKAAWILSNCDPAWRDWRCRIILEWAVDIRTVIKEDKPDALLGLYHCPWNDEEFDGARRRILGLDYDLLKDVIDVFSPMVYHGRMGREPVWVKENIEWFCKRLNIGKGTFPKVWPIVQAYNDPGIISKEEFEVVLRGGLSANSTGVMMFTSQAVAEDSLKIAIMKKVYKKAIRN